MSWTKLFDPRTQEPAIGAKLVLRQKSGSWLSGTYVGGDIVHVGDNFEIQLSSCVQYIEEPSEFQDFDKIPRMRREMTVTEKLDGQNTSVIVPLNGGDLLAAARNGYVTRGSDRFADFVYEHTDELRTLGPGRHFGEYWGPGIGKRKYPIPERRFSLFNVSRWVLHGETPQAANASGSRMQGVLPPCCGLVPVLYQGVFDTAKVDEIVEDLRRTGSRAVPGFMRPEGVVVYHAAANQYFKRTLEQDDIPKSLAGAAA